MSKTAIMTRSRVSSWVIDGEEVQVVGSILKFVEAGALALAASKSAKGKTLCFSYPILAKRTDRTAWLEVLDTNDLISRLRTRVCAFARIE